MLATFIKSTGTKPIGISRTVGHTVSPLSFLSVLASVLTIASTAQGQSGVTEWGVPDLQGNWKNATVMPFERPAELGTKRAYTEAEAIELERQAQQAVEEDNEPLDPDRPAPAAEAPWSKPSKPRARPSPASVADIIKEERAAKGTWAGVAR